MEATEGAGSPKGSIQQQAYDLFIKVSTGLHGPAVIISRLQDHLGLRGFSVNLRRGKDLFDLSEEEAREAMKILPELHRPRPGASDVAKLL